VAADLDRAQLEQLRDQVAAALEALPAPVLAIASRSRERPAPPEGARCGPRGGGYIEWKRIPHGAKVYGSSPHWPAGSCCRRASRSRGRRVRQVTRGGAPRGADGRARHEAPGGATGPGAGLGWLAWCARWVSRRMRSLPRRDPSRLRCAGVTTPWDELALSLRRARGWRRAAAAGQAGRRPPSAPRSSRPPSGRYRSPPPPPAGRSAGCP
jgi:hypothetical protein